MHKLLVKAIMVIPNSPRGIYCGCAQALMEELSILHVLPIAFFTASFALSCSVSLPSCKAALLILFSNADKA